MNQSLLLPWVVNILVVSTMLPVSLSEALAHSDTGAHSETNIQILKGQSIELDLRAICITELSHCSEQTLKISRQPAEGVIFSRNHSDIIRYQHAGTSTIDDSFVFTASTKGEDESILVSLKVSTDTPSLSISSPKSGASVKPGDLEIVFSVQGVGVDHVHLALSKEQHVSVSPDAESYTFYDVQPGSYTLTAALASSTHKDIANTEISLEIQVSD